MAAAGVPLERLGDYIGHASSYMTDRYRHLLEGQGASDASKLDEYVNSATGAQGGAHDPENRVDKPITLVLQNRGLQFRVLPPLYD
jgi:hypothetical protein